MQRIWILKYNPNLIIENSILEKPDPIGNPTNLKFLEQREIRNKIRRLKSIEKKKKKESSEKSEKKKKNKQSIIIATWIRNNGAACLINGGRLTGWKTRGRSSGRGEREDRSTREVGTEPQFPKERDSEKWCRLEGAGRGHLGAFTPCEQPAHSIHSPLSACAGAYVHPSHVYPRPAVCRALPRLYLQERAAAAAAAARRFPPAFIVVRFIWSLV